MPDRDLSQSATRAIRLKCMDCAAGQFTEIRLCQVTDCTLWPWRFGVSPKTARKKHGELMDPEHVLEVGYDDEDYACRERSN